jgi:hypothetical protein
MEKFYKFASESPFLTFFLAMLTAQMIVGIAQAIMGCK